MTRTGRVLLLVTSLFGLGVVAAIAAQDPAPRKPVPFQAFNLAGVVFRGRVTEAAPGPVGMSDPPLYTFTLSFDDLAVLKGAAPAAGTRFRYAERTTQQPNFPRGSARLVAAAEMPGRGWQITAILPADENSLALVRQAVALPVGWSLEEQQAVSPWASLGTRAWPDGAAPRAKVVCAKTGRPALLAGQGIELSVEQVIPPQADPVRNPYGNGEFTITVTNTNQTKAAVPALLRGEGKTLWADSLVVVHGGRAYLLPGAGGVPKTVESVELDPGQSLSTTVSVLGIQGIPWPRGGARVQLGFCLGELSKPSFFYYMQGFHDRLPR